MNATSPDSELRVLRAGELPVQLPEKAWLVRDIWSHLAVGFIAGHPKAGKTWLALDLAVSVASGTHCLGRFPVEQPGPVLAYLAEDSLPRVRERLAGICAHRHTALEALDFHLIDRPSLRLDVAEEQALLLEAVARLRPRLLVLDPLVRLHALDENSAAEVSALLGWLRTLSRTHQLAIVVVHHLSKKIRRNLGQALRGSGDLHAWSDSAAYLTRQQDKLLLTLEHRSSPARSPLGLQLASGRDGSTPHLEPLLEPVTSANSPPALTDRIIQTLGGGNAPLPRVALRQKLQVNNLKLGVALAALESDGLISRADSGWTMRTPAAATSHNATTYHAPPPPTSSPGQLELSLATATSNAR